MDIKEIIAELQKWQGEDKENRGLVILANERIAISEGGGECACALTAGVVGPESLLKSAIKVGLVKNKDLAHLLQEAAKESVHDLISQFNKDTTLS